MGREDAVAPPVGVEGGAGVVGPGAVDLHCEVRLGPEGIDLVAGEVDVELRLRAGRSRRSAARACALPRCAADGAPAGRRRARAGAGGSRAVRARRPGRPRSGRTRAGVSARSTALARRASLRTSARSTSVRATLVTGMPSTSARSASPMVREQWTVIPPRDRRPRTVVTSMPAGVHSSSPCRAPALRWLASAPGPHASTAASRPSARRERRCARRRKRPDRAGADARQPPDRRAVSVVTPSSANCAADATPCCASRDPCDLARAWTRLLAVCARSAVHAPSVPGRV